MTRQLRCGAIRGATALALLLSGHAAAVRAQIDPINERRWNVADGNYAEKSSWDQPDFSPPEARFGEGAILANGGIARVTGTILSAIDNTEATPGELRVSDGTLRIGAAGQLRVAAGDQGAAGITRISGAGTLAIEEGGTFATESLGLSGMLQLAVGGANFNLLEVAGAASLGGDLQVDFSSPAGASAGTWPLLQAGTLTGSFNSIVAAGIDLLPGQFFDVRAVPQAGGRVAAELFVDQLLTLQVHEGTGLASLVSPSGTAVEVDGYRIQSSGAALNASPTAWNSLADQVGAGWRKSNASSAQLAELKQTGSTSVDNVPLSLGPVYVRPAPTEFRVAPPGERDLVFDYTSPDGTQRRGVVDYIGGDSIVNDLLLTIDPTDGRVQLSNPSGFDVAIEGYSISSASGALQPAGWTSLDDADGPGNQDGGWRESNPSPQFLAELHQTGQPLLRNGTRLQLGSIYDFAAATEDLVFEFLLAGESEPLQGTVFYLPISAGVAGDFDGNGSVDGADFLSWQRNEGSAASFAAWESNFGLSAGIPLSGAVARAIPEPAAVALVAVIASLALASPTRRARCSVRSSRG